MSDPERSGIVEIRRAGLEDVDDLVRMREAMFREIGCEDEAAIARMAEESDGYFRESLPSESALAWVAQVDGESVANVVLVPTRWPPTPDNLAGVYGHVLNAYTHPRWRRRGIARRLLETAVEHMRRSGIPIASLHASRFGKPLYEGLGFADDDGHPWMEMPLT